MSEKLKETDKLAEIREQTMNNLEEKRRGRSAGWLTDRGH